MFIQVRSVVLSHECEVIVEPSTDAVLPTSTLVQLSQVGQTRLSWSCNAGRRARQPDQPDDADENEPESEMTQHRVLHYFRTEGPLNQTAFGASDRAATMSGHPSPSRSPIATP